MRNVRRILNLAVNWNVVQVIQRQENLARKQHEIREEIERKKAEVEEAKAKTRRQKARLAAEAARRRSPGAYSDDERKGEIR